WGFEEIEIHVYNEGRNIISLLQPWVEGEMLGDVLFSDHSASLQHEYVKVLCHFLLDFHAQGLCVYDLSHSNIMLLGTQSSRPRICLIDFELLQEIGTDAPMDRAPGFARHESYPDLALSNTKRFDFQLLFRILHYHEIIKTGQYNRLIGLSDDELQDQEGILNILYGVVEESEEDDDTQLIEIPVVVEEDTESLVSTIETPSPKQSGLGFRTLFRILFVFGLVFFVLLGLLWVLWPTKGASEEFDSLMLDFEADQEQVNPDIEEYFRENVVATDDPRRIFWRSQNAHLRKELRCNVSNRLLAVNNSVGAQKICPEQRERILSQTIQLPKTMSLEDKDRVLHKQINHSLWGNLKCLAERKSDVCEEYSRLSESLLRAENPEWIQIEAGIHIATTARGLQMNWELNTPSKRERYPFFGKNEKAYQDACDVVFERLVPIGQTKYYKNVYYALGYCMYFSKKGPIKFFEKKFWKEKAVKFYSIEMPESKRKYALKNLIIGACENIFDASKAECMKALPGSIAKKSSETE
ncbi:MAG: hypothetical protein VX278_06240, partial [Myxococcota bacterium]|nr:hypothetical protein [Myxococcota bacterium]